MIRTDSVARLTPRTALQRPSNPASEPQDRFEPSQQEPGLARRAWERVLDWTGEAVGLALSPFVPPVDTSGAGCVPPVFRDWNLPV